MLLSISTTHFPATDLGYLLHKNPTRLQSFDLSFGRAHVFYPQADESCCTLSLMLEVDAVGLVRGKRGERALEHYVNDRPYVASSFLSVALAQVFRDALGGRSRERPQLAQEKLPLHAHLTMLPCRGGEAFLRALFEPLGYELTTQSYVLDEAFPQWGQSPYFTIDLRAMVRLSDLLSHLYVLIPVTDDEKHYWVGEDEVEKLLRHGEGWLQSHPEREQIINRYLRRRRHLTREAFAQLTQDETPDADETQAAHDAEEQAVEKPISLHEQRLNAVVDVLKASGARRVLDLGCGEGRLLRLLIKEKQFEEIVGVDVSHRVLQIARERTERLPPLQQARIKLLQGALTYRDARLHGYDAAAVVEVVEHLDPSRLAAFARVLFEFARPATVAITTPNSEYNIKWESLPAGTMRHKDHRFEWTRAEFQTWANEVASRFGYGVEISPVGPEDEIVGAPTQMAVFTLAEIESDLQTVAPRMSTHVAQEVSNDGEDLENGTD